MTRVLVVGGGGFIGAHLVRALSDHDADVTVVDCWRRYGAPASQRRELILAWRREHLLAGARVHSLSLSDAGAFARVVAESSPEVVVQLANLPLARRALERPREAHREIVGVTAELLRALARAPCLARLVYVSSSMVYGDFEREPMGEDGSCRPREPYGALKREAELLVCADGAARGYQVTVVRPSAVYGPGDLHDRFMGRLLGAAHGGLPLALTDSPGTALDFTFVEDLADGLRLACTHPAAGDLTFNLTRGEGRTLAEAIAIVRGLGYPLAVAREPSAFERFRPRRGALDISRARRLLGYDPPHSLESGLARSLDPAARDALSV
ncbi:MAG: NAD(P)-dependent oxidoreductase [Solirubrobacteraceae bacterium]|jgi:nucleoside-diphosphate-sugar epimerase